MRDWTCVMPDSNPRDAATRDRFDLTVVIPAHNEERHIAEQLEALSLEVWPDGRWEVIVVDNRSTDRTVEIAEGFRDRLPSLRVVAATDGAGVSYAKNVGFQHARSDLVATCDADDVVAAGWVVAMGAALQQHRFVAGPLEVDRLNPKWLADTRGRRVETGLLTFRDIFPIAPAGNVGLHRSLWESLGGFSVDAAGAEDADFSMRAWLAGERLHFEPAAVLHYRYRGDARSLWRQGRGYGRGRVWVCRELKRRNLPTARLYGWRSWAWLILHLPGLVSSSGRLAWLWVAANRIGQLEGSVRFRTVYL